MRFWFFFLAATHSLRDLSSLIRNQTQPTAVKAPSPNHWTAREFPPMRFLCQFIYSAEISFSPRFKLNSKWACPCTVNCCHDNSHKPAPNLEA